MSDTMTILETDAEISINGGPRNPGRVTVEQQILVERSATATKPNAAWTHVDDQGHFHAYDDEGKLPSLLSRTRHVECDGVHNGPMLDPDSPCEGYDIAEWFCLICDEHIEPGRVPDHGPIRIPALKSWRAEIRSDRVVAEGLVSVQAYARDRMLFGAGMATVGQVDYGPEGTRVRTDIVGASALGSRKLP